MTGRSLGEVPPESLTDTRLQLHHAIQPLTSFSQALVEPLEDDRHRSFDWDIGIRGFRTRPASLVPEVTAAFAVETFEFRVEREDVVLASIPARGRTVTELRTLLRQATREALPTSSETPEFVPPEFDLPDHAVAGGKRRLAPDAGSLAEIARWYTYADRALLRLGERFDLGMDPARVWPHHFDLATLLHVEGGTVGVGMSPGDDEIPHPYWYVRGYPNNETVPDPAGTDRPDLVRGHWTVDGWTGAVLESPDLTGGTMSADRQDEATDTFLDTTISIFVDLLGGDDDPGAPRS